MLYKTQDLPGGEAWNLVTRSESAPVPVPRHARRDLGLMLHTSLGSTSRNGSGAGGVDGAGGIRRGAVDVVGRAGVAAAAADGRGLAVGAAAPRLELVVAVLAGAAHGAARVVVGVLVKRDLEGRVRVAEDVAAAAAVMAPRPVVEVAHAGGLVADRGVGIGLGLER